MLRNITLICAVLILILLVLIYQDNSRVLIQSSVDGNYYRVLKEYPNCQDAANLLGEINVSAMSFMRYLKGKYHIDETDDIIASNAYYYARINSETGRDVYIMMNTLLDNFNYETLYENDPRNLTGDTSYTVNKGARMYLCLRRKSDPMKLIDFNTLMFCFLHEIAHIANYNGWGHPTRFWTIFRLILHEAILFGIYQYVDYGRYPIMYCGLQIEYQPLDDPTLPNLWEMF